MQPDPERMSLLVNLARAYYEQGLTQDEISRTLPISRSQVSRYLSEARDLGIVQFRIIDPSERVDDLGAALVKRFPTLETAVVVPLFTQDVDMARRMVGMAGASYLRQTVMPGQCLCIGHGRTVRATIDALKSHPVPSLSVVQAMGNLGHEALNVDFNTVARAAADAFNAHAFYVNAPAILGVGTGTAATWEAANISIRESLERAREADIYLVSVGALEHDQRFTRTGLVPQADMEWLLAQKAAGDICARFYDIQGREIVTPFSDRIVGISLQDLHRAHLSIGVVGGVEKATALYGALMGGWLNVLITDEHTARAILAMKP